MSLYRPYLKIRGYIFTICPLVFFVLVLTSSAFSEVTKIEKTYTSRDADTLIKVAYRIYGHKTWWELVKKENHNLKKYKKDDVLPVGTIITYQAPKIEDQYLVQSGDTLSRIAEWKYGNLDIWNKIYDGNKDSIQNPNLIEPGITLKFEQDGTIKNAETGEVIVKGVELIDKLPPSERVQTTE